MSRPPTAPVAAASLIAGYGLAVASGSRPLGGLLMAVGGLWCVRQWQRDHGTPTATALGGAGLFAFAASHGLARVTGAWPAVITVSALVAVAVWRGADARPVTRGPGVPLGPPAVPGPAGPPDAEARAEPAR
jgi:hypothetical protein